VFLKGIGDVFEEDEAKDDMLVLGRVHVAAELVRGEPELGFEAEVGGGVVLRGGAGAGHLRAFLAEALAFAKEKSAGRNPALVVGSLLIVIGPRNRVKDLRSTRFLGGRVKVLRPTWFLPCKRSAWT
jgi:hypothetical protein